MGLLSEYSLCFKRCVRQVHAYNVLTSGIIPHIDNPCVSVSYIIFNGNECLKPTTLIIAFTINMEI